jgi:hypothetical protein
MPPKGFEWETDWHGVYLMLMYMMCSVSCDE